MSTKTNEGCELCGDWPVLLSPRCHLNAPLKAEMEDEKTLILRCYVPECGREVARFNLAEEKTVDQKVNSPTHTVYLF